jgi:hypothetical protein
MIVRYSQVRLVACLAAVVMSAACERGTARLTSEQEARFQAEGIVRRADDLMFRYTRDPGGRSERREERRASIVVTSSSVLIHKNDKLGLEITPRTRRDVSVERSGDRVRIRSGRGQSEEIWSFVPPGDAPGWATDLRTALGKSAGEKRR